jgi:hypothetical protein
MLDDISSKKIANYRDRFIELHERQDGPGMADLAVHLLEDLEAAYESRSSTAVGVRSRLSLLEYQVDYLMRQPRFPFWRRK